MGKLAAEKKNGYGTRNLRDNPMEEQLAAIKLAKIVIATMNTRDFVEFAKHLADDAVFDFPGSGEVAGKKRIIIFLKALLRKYPELAFTIEDTIAEDHKACICWTNKGISSKGEPYHNRGVTLVYMAAGKIVYISDYFKDTSFTKS